MGIVQCPNSTAVKKVLGVAVCSPKLLTGGRLPTSKTGPEGPAQFFSYLIL
jgi:hypothetical protein